MERPNPQHYNHHHAGYIRQVNGDDIPALLKDQKKEIVEIYAKLDDATSLYAYKPEKWTYKELLGHLIDAERIFVYRSLRIARKDTTPLPGYDENQYVIEGKFNQRTLQSLIDEFTLLREASIIFVETLSPEACNYTGVANEQLTSVSALMFILTGHTEHHLRIIKERYLTP